MREGNRCAKQRRVFHVAAGAHEICGNDGFSVTGLKSVQCSQPERDSDSGDQPSGTELGLTQELRKIVRVHTFLSRKTEHGAVSF